MTRTHRLLIAALPALATLLFASGCGSSGPELGEVSGKVTLNGKPLANAKVLFQPVKKGGSPSTARTDAEGDYTLKYLADREGAVLGKHKVTVSTYRQESQPDGTTREIPEQVPAKYTSVTTTPLEFEIKPGSQEILLELRP